jgi:CubicO group peptidase (beta-lactamase class C family)
MSQATARHITFSLILTIVAVMEVSSTTLPPAIPLKKDIDKGAWISDLETLIPQLMERAHVPGLSIAVIRDAEIIWTGSFGVKSNETKEAVNDTTVFQAASLSKTTFAYAVMKLVERRELDLDTPLSDYLPGRYIENDDRVKLITARMVLSHTTGFPNWRPKGGALRLYFTPGEKFSYSGEGYVYLQKVVEHITGQPLDRFMQEQVFKPLGMRHSSYEWRDEYESNHAVGHNKFAIATDRGRMRHANAAASLYTTARDYARFLVAMMRGTGLQEKSIGEMLTPQVQLESCVNCTRSKLLPSKLSEVNSWGLGWGLQTTDEGTSFWHWGDQGIFMCYTAAFKDQKLGLVYFTNSKNGLAIRNELVYRTIGGRHPAFSWLQYDSYQVLDFPGSLPTTRLKEIPAAYTIPYGDIVYVENDGRCSQGKVIKITGGHGGRGIPRKYECVKRQLVQAQPPSFDFSGIWSGRGYQCVDPQPPQYVVIKIEDGDVTATKLTGDSCIRAGEVTWRGKYTGNPFPGQMSGRRPELFWFDVMIRIVDENTINVSGAVFTRVEVPSPSWVLQRKVPMSAETLERLTKIAESISTEDRKVSPMQVAAQLLEESLRRPPTEEDRLPIDTPKVDTTVDASVYDDYVGQYAYAILTVTREGDRLFAQLTGFAQLKGQPKFEIFPKSETEFFWKVADAQVTFVKNEAGLVTHARHRQHGEFEAPKIK